MGLVVVDASALIAFLRDEEGAELVESMLADESTQAVAHAINLAELYRAFLVRSDSSKADEALSNLTAGGLIAREDLDEELWKRAAVLKAHLRWEGGTDGSYADCLCAALAERLGATAVTTDHGEFGPFERLGVCTVRFIR